MVAKPAGHEPIARNYPYNCWWVAAFADEVGRVPLGRWLLDTPVVLYRTQGGEVVALEDRCPHRQAPLSIGKLQGDAIECGYHGFQFGRDGRCVRVPTMASPPPISIETFPVREIGPLVWVYLGDSACLDAVPPPPTMAWMSDPSFAMRQSKTEIAANYLLLKENVLDLTHFGYVHAGSFGITNVVGKLTVTRTDDTVGYEEIFDPAPLPDGLSHAFGIAPGTPWSRSTKGAFLSPAAQYGSASFADPKTPETPNASHQFAHFTTPIDHEHMHYFYVFGRDYAREPAAMDHFAAMVEKGFKEDEFVLEQVQALISRRPRRGSTGERSVKADAAGVEARRIIERWMQRETIPA
ncbi:aromatic ring-hydroxylating dioxygenase subunit alpha [Rhizorhabdus wittichii]|uniref:aromatic ring-hydroxylating dioxygenase subunit alpha n=1 Tax=Rhizorhabdus wittichii TaxID=160791 RepID=UPI001D0144F5|nr:aromatic ring-hydroxylating dioxygenase subunit alpha [Rhizorhabdus wittichii]